MTIEKYPKHLTIGSTDVPSTEGKLRLYSMRFCPYAQRAHLILLAKKIPHDVVNINLKAKPEWFLERFPLGKVPCLVTAKGDELYESLIICDYLDEAFGDEKLNPSDPLQKAKDRILVELFGKVTSALYKALWTQGSYFDLTLLEPVYNELDYFEKELSKRGTPFFAGKKMGMVDYMIWPWFERLEMVKILGGSQFKVPKERFPKLIEWGLKAHEDEAVKQYCIPPEIHAKFAQSHLAGTPDYDNVAC